MPQRAGLHDWISTPLHEARGEVSTDADIALVTGAASGIGRAIASALAAEGRRIVLLDNDAGGLEQVHNTIAHSHAVVLDITDKL